MNFYLGITGLRRNPSCDLPEAEQSPIHYLVHYDELGANRARNVVAHTLSINGIHKLQR